MKWLVVSGTNRAGAESKMVSEYVAAELRARRGADEISVLDLKDLPTEAFSPEIYASKPKSVEEFISGFIEADALVCVLPEYNGSAPGVFKFFIDLLPFPESLLKTPVMFVGLSAGRFGAVRSVEHMSQVFVYRNALVYPESLFFPQVGEKFEGSKLVDPFTLKIKDSIFDGFVEFADQNKKLG
jgi:NAD(P)H-dependent FMN reductase